MRDNMHLHATQHNSYACDDCSRSYAGIFSVRKNPLTNKIGFSMFSKLHLAMTLYQANELLLGWRFVKQPQTSVSNEKNEYFYERKDEIVRINCFNDSIINFYYKIHFRAEY